MNEKEDWIVVSLDKIVSLHHSTPTELNPGRLTIHCVGPFKHVLVAVGDEGNKQLAKAFYHIRKGIGNDHDKTKTLKILLSKDLYMSYCGNSEK